MLKHNNKIRNIAITWMVLVAFVSLLAATMAFTHIHVLPNGRVVVHSHALPAGATTGQEGQHSHTQTGFYIFASFTSLALKLSVPLATLGLVCCKFAIPLFCNSFKSQTIRHSISLRAPPALSL